MTNGKPSFLLELYPEDEFKHLLKLIPKGELLKFSKLLQFGAVTTDTCNGAVKLGEMLRKHIRQVAIEEGLNEKDIKVVEILCWNHLRNLWIDEMSKRISLRVTALVLESLEQIPVR